MTPKPNDHSSRLQRSAALGLALMALGGCSTIASVSPFQSNVPYAANILPTVPRPENPDKPAFQKAPEPLPAPPTPAAEAPAAPPAPAPQPAQAAPPTPAPPPAAAPAPAAKPAPAAQSSPAATPAPEQQGDADDKPPSIALEKRQFQDDGRYPNLAQTPSRPPNLPTFADAATLRKSLEADAAKASQPATASPTAPSPQSVADAAPAKPAAPVPASAAGVTARAEDRAPCLDNAQAGSRPTASVHFAAGSAALTADGREALAEAMTTVRGSKGTIHVLGHGDAEPASDLAPPRFDLAIARAGAIAQALAGFGIPAQRIAVGVACADFALAGASVQLYTES